MIASDEAVVVEAVTDSETGVVVVVVDATAVIAMEVAEVAATEIRVVGEVVAGLTQNGMAATANPKQEAVTDTVREEVTTNMAQSSEATLAVVVKPECSAVGTLKSLQSCAI